MRVKKIYFFCDRNHKDQIEFVTAKNWNTDKLVWCARVTHLRHISTHTQGNATLHGLINTYFNIYFPHNQRSWHNFCYSSYFLISPLLFNLTSRPIITAKTVMLKLRIECFKQMDNPFVSKAAERSKTQGGYRWH